jgi:hypothetical protein
MSRHAKTKNALRSSQSEVGLIATFALAKYQKIASADWRLPSTKNGQSERVVYDFYGLTEEEIVLIEGS